MEMAEEKEALAVKSRRDAVLWAWQAHNRVCNSLCSTHSGCVNACRPVLSSVGAVSCLDGLVCRAGGNICGIGAAPGLVMYACVVKVMRAYEAGLSCTASLCICSLKLGKCTGSLLSLYGLCHVSHLSVDLETSLTNCRSISGYRSRKLPMAAVTLHTQKYNGRQARCAHCVYCPHLRLRRGLPGT